MSAVLLIVFLGAVVYLRLRVVPAMENDKRAKANDYPIGE